MNPFFSLQTRLRDLIAAHAYFAAVAADEILTEQIADLEYQVESRLLNIGFGIVITTAAGKAVESTYGALVSDEDLNISIVHNPTLKGDYNALEAQWAAMQAVHGQTCLAVPPHVLTERDYFRVVGHQRRLDGPAGVNVRELHVTAGLRLL